jgi:hypothetical protein
LVLIAGDYKNMGCRGALTSGLAKAIDACSTRCRRRTHSDAPRGKSRGARSHANGQPTGTIDVYQGEAAHFSVELEAIAAFLRAALVANKNSN